MTSDADRFDQWLDDLVSHRHPSTPTGSDDLTRAVSAAAEAHDAPNPKAPGTSWKAMESMLVPTSQRHASAWRRPTFGMVNTAASIVAVAAIVIGLLGTGYLYGTRNGDSANSDGRAYISAASATPEVVEGNAGIFQVEFWEPTAADCDVEPLTRGDMINKLNNPMFPYAEIDNPAWKEPASSNDYPVEAVPLSEEITAQLREAVHTVSVCQLIGGGGRLAAVTTSHFFFNRYFGAHVGAFESTTVEDLVDSLLEQQSSPDSGTYTWDPELADLWLPQVPENAVAYQISSTQVAVPVVWVKEDGTTNISFGADGIMSYGGSDPPLMHLPIEWVFRLNPTNGIWELDWARNSLSIYPVLTL
jgi:hypothetical protein